MLGMALALQQLAPWASDWWVEAGPRLAQQASDAEGKTSSEYTTNETVRVELTVNATLPMLMLTVERGGAVGFASTGRVRYIVYSMNKLPKRPRDTAQLAKLALDMATGEVENDKEPVLEALREQEQPPAGRAKSAKARAASQTPERRMAIAKQAAAARWGTSVTT